ncbi:hypothetical protein Tco_1251845 [Tanacetum coccineum]
MPLTFSLNFVSHAMLSLCYMLFCRITMAEKDCSALHPTKNSWQIVHSLAWLQSGKSKPSHCIKDPKVPLLLDISGILKNTYFFQALTASAKVLLLPATALAITPVNPTHPFELPPTGDTVLDFVNELGYPEPIEFVSSIRTNYVYQPWRAILSLLNQCLTGKTSGSDKPRHPVLQMLWGIVTQTNVDHAELIWEEFTQGIQTFFSHKASHKAVEGPRRSNSSLIPYGRSPKKSQEGHDEPATKRASPRSPQPHTCHIKPAPSPNKERELPSGGKKLSLETHQEKGKGEGDDADLELAIKLSLDPALLPQGRAPVGGVTIRDPVSEATPKLHEVVGKGKAVVSEEQVAHSLIDLSKKKRTTDQFILARRDQSPPDSTTGPSSRPDDDTSEKVIHESSSTSDSERTESDTESGAPKGDKVQGEIVSSTVTSGVSIPVSDPEKAHEPPRFMKNLNDHNRRRVIDDKPESHSGSMSSMKNLDDTFNFGDQFLHDKPTEDDQEKSKAREESDSTIPDPSHQTVTSTPPVIAPFTEVSSSKPSLLVTPPPINTEATTITTSLPEITPFIALQLRVARLEQEMSEVKKTDHSADVLASIRSQVPTAVDNYLGTKLDDALLKVLERHTADLIEKYSVLPGPESVKNQESEKSPKEIIKAKKEQDEEKQDSTYSIRSTDKVDIEEFDLKSALFNHMNKKKSANKNKTNYRLYHALIEALIADEDAMDKEVADKVKDHKRKHDSDDDEDDDDDEGPSAGSNQGRSTKKRRSDSAASGSAKPPPKDEDQSSKKPRETEASASKQHPALTSTGWQITDTREAGVDSSMHKSDPELEHSEQSSDDISMQDKGHSQGVDHYVV